MGGGVGKSHTSKRYDHANGSRLWKASIPRRNSFVTWLRPRVTVAGACRGEMACPERHLAQSTVQENARSASHVHRQDIRRLTA